MVADLDPYPTLNREWKSFTRLMFGEEIGELKLFEEWLSEYVGTLRVEKSAVSGKEVALAIGNYSKSATFASHDEID